MKRVTSSEVARNFSQLSDQALSEPMVVTKNGRDRLVMLGVDEYNFLIDTIDDLGIDSLDFLDIVFAIDKEFGIKIPLEKWTQDVNEGKVATEEYFVLKNLCAKIDELRAAKA